MTTEAKRVDNPILWCTGDLHIPTPTTHMQISALWNSALLPLAAGLGAKSPEPQTASQHSPSLPGLSPPQGTKAQLKLAYGDALLCVFTLSWASAQRRCNREEVEGHCIDSLLLALFFFFCFSSKLQKGQNFLYIWHEEIEVSSLLW